MSPALRDLKSRWAKLDRDLLPFAGEPENPTARRIVREQKEVTKLIHHAHAAEGEKAKKGGGDTSDLVVVGAGPAGLSAAVYGAREGLDTLLIDSDTKAGGQARHSSRIENVVGFPTGVTGTQFATRGLEQAERLGADTKFGVSVRRMAYDPQSGMKHLMLSDGTTIHAKAVVIAGGVQFRKMSFEGATDCPDIVYGDSEALKKRSRGKRAVIVGGANSAGQAAIDTAAKVPVTILLRHGEIGDKMSSYLVDQIESDPKINVEIGEVASVQTTAAKRMASVTLKDGKKIPCGALGLFIGAGPETDWADVERDDHGYIIVGRDGSTAFQTSVPGVFAAGDVRAGSIHRSIAAAADGAAAVSSTHEYLASVAPAGRANPAAGPRRPVPAVTEADKWMDAMDALDQEYPFTGFDGVAPDSRRGRENPPAGFLDVGPISTEALAPGDVFQDSSSAVYRVDAVKSAHGGKLRFHLTRPAHGVVPEDAVGSHTFEKGEKAGFRLLKPDTRHPLTNGLDFYKATMSQLQWKTHPDAQVTFELKNRSKTTRIADYVGVDELQERLDAFKHGWSSRELAYLGGLKTKDGSRPLFDPEFIAYLRSNSLPPITVGKDDTGELTVKTTGPWPLVTFWETVALSTTNDVYFENYAKKHHLNLADLRKEGDRRLSEKIKVLHEHPEIKLAEFGTRRRFSSDWQHHVIDRLQAEAPENYLGSSNIAASDDNGTSPIGSYAHEVEMVYAAIADKADGEGVTGPATATEHVLDDWRSLYGEDLGIALTDTFTTAAFFHAFTK
ncbi:MAG: FAD-dependent oxidoreductase, partial [Propionibacteriales bacterium]|nr:FAD-dependent oxidoreductase [Propionibacteriales bacterium]